MWWTKPSNEESFEGFVACNFDTKSIEYISNNQVSNNQDNYCLDAASSIILDKENLKNPEKKW